MSAILAQARLKACKHWPFASHAILSMVPVPRPGLGTLAVDQHLISLEIGHQPAQFRDSEFADRSLKVLHRIGFDETGQAFDLIESCIC